MNIVKRYTELRRKGWPALQAIRKARIEHEFDLLDGEQVRLCIESDELCNMEDLKGDCFNPEVNSDIPASRLAREEREFEVRVRREGVYGVIGEYKCPHCNEWTQVDSCWGFVGDDWKDSGYDTDIMGATLEAYYKASGHKPHA